MHGGKQRRHHIAVHRPRNVVVLEGKGVPVPLGFVEQKRADHPAGRDLAEKIQRVGNLLRGGGIGTAVVHAFAALFGDEDSLADIFLELLAQGGFIEYHRPLKSAEVCAVDDIHQLRDGFSDARRVQNVKQNKMQGDVAVGKALCLPGLIERVVRLGAAVDREEYALPLGAAHELHVVPEPAFDAAALVVIRARALFVVFLAAFEAVDIKLAHIRPNPLVVFDELAVRRHGTPLLCSALRG